MLRTCLLFLFFQCVLIPNAPPRSGVVFTSNIPSARLTHFFNAASQKEVPQSDPIWLSFILQSPSLEQRRGGGGGLDHPPTAGRCSLTGTSTPATSTATLLVDYADSLLAVSEAFDRPAQRLK